MTESTPFEHFVILRATGFRISAGGEPIILDIYGREVNECLIQRETVPTGTAPPPLR